MSDRHKQANGWTARKHNKYDSSQRNFPWEQDIVGLIGTINWCRQFSYFSRLCKWSALWLKRLGDASPHNSTTVLYPRSVLLRLRSGFKPEPCECGCVVGLLVIGSHEILDSDSTMPHSILQKVQHPDGQWAGGPRPARGGGGKWLAAHPEIDSPLLSASLPTLRDRHRHYGHFKNTNN